MKNLDAQETGSFLDARDGNIYETIKIGNQVWMAENRAYEPGSGNFRVFDLKKYGCVYDWQTAKDVCPTGWHIPSKSEFETLINTAGGSGIAYYELKDGGGSGFDALPGGWHNGSDYDVIGSTGHWWSSSKERDYTAWYLFVQAGYAGMKSNSKSMGLSVRCLRD